MISLPTISLNRIKTTYNQALTLIKFAGRCDEGETAVWNSVEDARGWEQVLKICESPNRYGILKIAMRLADHEQRTAMLSTVMYLIAGRCRGERLI